MDYREDELCLALKRHFNFPSFRLGQLNIINSVLSNHDSLAVLPTGGGKSICYQLPALVRPGITLVVSPLISLMKDQVDALNRMGIPAGCLHSDQSVAEKKSVFQTMKNSAQFLLYLSPERVQKSGFLTWLKGQNFNLFAIDEAHCVSKWGHDFREDYHRLNLLRRERPDVPILALTATATKQVLLDITKRLELRNPARHIYGFYRPNLFYQVEDCKDEDEKFGFLKAAIRSTPQGRILIYCGTRKQCEHVYSTIQDEFEDSYFYHAGLNSSERTQIQNDYDSNKIRILAATNAFGMGIDHPDVRLVIHFQMPANIESLYQEMGRAGRDQKNSTCLLLYSKKDKGLQSFFIRESKADVQTIRHRWDALDAIIQFAEGGECRHAGILTYFRDAHRITACGHCDICAPRSERKIVKPRSIALIRRKAPKPSREEILPPLSKAQQLRAELLREWRKSYAESNDLPAFMIFSNRSLHELAAKAPQNLEELSKVYGFGPHKVEHLGKHILECLKN